MFIINFSINKFRYFVLTGILSSFTLITFAQPIVGNGCKLPNNRRYQVSIPSEPGYNPLFRNAPGDKNSLWEGTDENSTLYACYRWISSGGACYVKVPGTSMGCGFFGLQPCPASYTLGVSGYFTSGNVPCPIDDYIPFILLATAGLGFLYLKRKSKIIYNNN